MRILLLLAAAVPWAAAAQQATVPCPEPAQVTQADMLGLWRAEFQGRAQGATLLIEKHPEYESSLAGAINRNGERGRLAGDLEDGELTLEESADGKRIDAVWLGEVVEGSCGREVRGTWQPDGGEGPAEPFVLKKR
jgi:hypothetical protein